MDAISVTGIVPFGSNEPAQWDAHCHACHGGRSFDTEEELDAWREEHVERHAATA